MPIGDTLGGFIRPGYNPLLVTDAPTIGTASPGGALAVSITFTAPSDVGGGAITSYEAIATDTVSAASFVTTGTSSPITVTGLTSGRSYTVTVTAINAYGPSGMSAASNSSAEGVLAELWTWGSGTSGGTGHGNTTDTSSPVQVGALTTWKYVSVGYQTMQAIQLDGTLWGWGENGSGQIGDGTTDERNSPVQVGALTDWSVEMVMGSNHAIAVKTDGTLWAWGLGTSGGLGVGGGGASRSSPTQIGALTTWVTVSSGNNFSASVKTDGTLWTWGANSTGQGGRGDTSNTSSPVQVGALTNWLKVTAGYGHMAAVKTDGTLWAWGVNTYGQLGDSSTTNRSSPVQVGALTDWLTVSGSYRATFATKTDGTIWAFGRGHGGTLGTGNTTTQSSPVQIGALTTWDAGQSLLGGHGGGGDTKTDGTLWMWGQNWKGQLGQGSTTEYSSPVQVGALTTWINISLGGSGGPQTAALKEPS